MSFRRVVFLAAAFVMPISGCGRSPAPMADAQRLPDRLQEKMGRAPNESGDGRQIASSALPEATAAIEEARNKLRTLLAAKEREFAKLQEPTMSMQLMAERMAKYGREKSELSIAREQEVDQIARIEKALKESGPEEGNKRALVMLRQLGVKYRITEMPSYQEMLDSLFATRQELLKQRGESDPVIKQLDDKIALIRRFLRSDKDSGPKVCQNPDDARTYVAIMKEEIKSADAKIEALDKLMDAETQKARENPAFEKAQRIGEEMVRLRQMLSGLDATLAGQSSPK
jgi:hypothetical protein